MYLRQTWYVKFVYCLLQVFHSSQCKSVFQTSMMDFLIDVYQGPKSATTAVAVKSTWQCESILGEYLLIKVKGLFSQLISFRILPCLKTSGPIVYGTTILCLAFPGFFEGTHNGFLWQCKSFVKETDSVNS